MAFGLICVKLAKALVIPRNFLRCVFSLSWAVLTSATILHLPVVGFWRMIVEGFNLFLSRFFFFMCLISIICPWLCCCHWLNQKICEHGKAIQICKWCVSQKYACLTLNGWGSTWRFLTNRHCTALYHAPPNFLDSFNRWPFKTCVWKNCFLYVSSRKLNFSQNVLWKFSTYDVMFWIPLP